MTRGRLIGFGVLTCVAIGTCIRLGFWQLDRLAQRRARNAVVTSRGAEPVVPLERIAAQDTSASHWRRVRLRGVADYPAELVHATRTQGGMPGVHVLTPVKPLAGAWGDTAVLVIRGYLAAPDGRTIDFGAVREPDTLDLDVLVLAYPVLRTGLVTMPSNAGAVCVLDRDTLSVKTGRPLARMLLLALGDTVIRDVAVLTRVPPPAITEGPHLSYALQWFGFATVFGIGFLAVAWPRRRTRPATGGRPPQSA